MWFDQFNHFWYPKHRLSKAWERWRRVPEMTNYSKTSHTVFYHRFHVVWITKYRKRVLSGELRLRLREIIAQVAEELNIKIINGVLSADHVHMFAEIPPHTSVSEFVRIAKGRPALHCNCRWYRRLGRNVPVLPCSRPRRPWGYLS